eukprot:315886-Hanusia_phi.AAC.7
MIRAAARLEARDSELGNPPAITVPPSAHVIAAAAAKPNKLPTLLPLLSTSTPPETAGLTRSGG